MARRVKWNGVKYPSIRAAAKAIGVSVSAMWYRVQRVYTSDNDLWQK